MEYRDDFRKILKIFEEFPDKLFADSIETHYICNIKINNKSNH